MKKKISISKESITNALNHNKSIREVASKLGSSKSTIMRLMKRFKMKSNELSGGIPRLVSTRMKDKLGSEFSSCDLLSARDGINFLKNAIGKTVSKQTVLRELAERGLKCRVRPKKPHVTEARYKNVNYIIRLM